MNKFWTIRAQTEETPAELTLYGDILPSEDFKNLYNENTFCITPEGFADDLNTLSGASKITVRLNSCGGDPYTGIAIHNALKALSAEVNIVVEGIAASAASIIMCAGDTVSVYPGSLIMIHSCYLALMGWMNENDIKAALNSVEATNSAICEVYNRKTGIGESRLRNMMNAETWFTGKDAVKFGFADELLDGDCEKEYDEKRNFLKCAGLGIDLNKEKFMNITEIIDNVKNKVCGTAPVELVEDSTPSEAWFEATIAEAAAAATAEERARLKAIDAIADTIVDKSLLEVAKYGDNTMTAEALAFADKQREAGAVKAAAEALEKDAEESKTDEVCSAVEDTRTTAQRAVDALYSVFAPKKDTGDK